MAGDWIKMRIDLPEDPSVISIAADLDASEDLVVGKLLRIWGWANRNTVDGNAPSVTKSWLDRYVSSTGFADAMVKAGWLVAMDRGVSFPKFDSHMSDGAKTRALTAKRVSSKRNADSNGASVTNSLPEKRREEKNKEEEIREENTEEEATPSSPFLERWNATPGVQNARSMTPGRMKAFKVRCKSNGWPESVEEALERVAASDFCLGKNDRGWVADIDWFLRPDTLTKILEGKYDNSAAKGTKELTPMERVALAMAPFEKHRTGETNGR